MPLQVGTKKRKKSIKTPSVSKLKKKLWKLFSQYVRQRAADWRGNATCVTCGVVKHWKEMQAGHFIPGRHNAILFALPGVNVQCYRCNVPLKGNPRAYDKYMRETYGEDVIKELEKLDKQNKQFTVPELQKLLEHYSNLLKTL